MCISHFIIMRLTDGSCMVIQGVPCEFLVIL